MTDMKRKSKPGLVTRKLHFSAAGMDSSISETIISDLMFDNHKSSNLASKLYMNIIVMDGST